MSWYPLDVPVRRIKKRLVDGISKHLRVPLQATSSHSKHILSVKRLAEETPISTSEKPPEPEIRQVGDVNYYYVGNKGPYCQPCFDEKRKLIFLTPPLDWNGGIRRKCEVCNKFFYERPMTSFPGPVYVR